MNEQEYDAVADATMFAALRHVWETVDPLPVDLVDRMVAAVAVEDLSREYALLTLVHADDLAAVRGESDTLTLQFSDGKTSVLLHVSELDAGTRRVDGWVDAAALAVRFAQGEREWSADPGENGRFAFDGIPPGLSRIRLIIRDDDQGGLHEFMTPQFEV